MTVEITVTFDGHEIEKYTYDAADGFDAEEFGEWLEEAGIPEEFRASARLTVVDLTDDYEEWYVVGELMEALELDEKLTPGQFEWGAASRLFHAAEAVDDWSAEYEDVIDFIGFFGADYLANFGDAFVCRARWDDFAREQADEFLDREGIPAKSRVRIYFDRELFANDLRHDYLCADDGEERAIFRADF